MGTIHVLTSCGTCIVARLPGSASDGKSKRPVGWRWRTVWWHSYWWSYHLCHWFSPSMSRSQLYCCPSSVRVPWNCLNTIARSTHLRSIAFLGQSLCSNRYGYAVVFASISLYSYALHWCSMPGDHRQGNRHRRHRPPVTISAPVPDHPLHLYPILRLDYLQRE